MKPKTRWFLSILFVLGAIAFLLFFFFAPLLARGAPPVITNGIQYLRLDTDANGNQKGMTNLTNVSASQFTLGGVPITVWPSGGGGTGGTNFSPQFNTNGTAVSIAVGASTTNLQITNVLITSGVITNAVVDGNGGGLSNIMAAYITNSLGPWSNAVTANIANVGSFNQTNQGGNGAYGSLTTNLHFSLTDENGDTFLTRTNGDFESRSVNGNYFAASNGNGSNSGSFMIGSNLNAGLALTEQGNPVVTNNEPGVTLAGAVYATNITGLQTAQAMAARADFVNGLRGMGVWSNAVSCAFFGSNMNTGLANGVYRDMVTYATTQGTLPNGSSNYAGFAVNCLQTNSGYYLNGSTSYLLQTNIPPQSGPITVIVFCTGMGWSQTSSAALGGLYNNAGFVTGSAQLIYNGSAGPLLASVDNAYNSPNGLPINTDSAVRCYAVATDRTNLTLINSGFNYGTLTGPWASQTTVMGVVSTSVEQQIVIGARYGGGSSFGQNFNGIIHGYLVVSNYLSLAQVQQIYNRAFNSGCLEIYRGNLAGDSLTSTGAGACGSAGFSFNIITNWPIWGNCVMNQTAVGGSQAENVFSRVEGEDLTNAPNGIDVKYPSFEMYSPGINSFAILPMETAAYMYGLVSNAVILCHARATKFYVSTLIETVVMSTNGDATNLNWSAYNALVRANTAGADGVTDIDQYWFNLLGTNYYTNGTYYCLASPPHMTPTGATQTAAYMCGVIGTNLFAANNYNTGYSQESTLPGILPLLEIGNPLGLNITGSAVTTNFSRPGLVITSSGGGGGSQTPLTNTVNGAQFALTNLASLNVGGAIVDTNLTVSNTINATNIINGSGPLVITGGTTLALNSAGGVSMTGGLSLTGGDYSGNGSLLTALPGANITAASENLSSLVNAGANTVVGNATGSAAAPAYTGSPSVSNLTASSNITATLTNTAAIFVSTNQSVNGSGFTGNGSGLTNLNLLGQRMLSGGDYGQNIPTSNTKYWPIFGWVSVSASVETNASAYFPGVCLLTNLTLSCQPVLGAGTNVVFTVMTNGVATGLTVTISSATTGSLAQDLTHSAQITNAWVDLKLVTTLTTATAQYINWTMNY